jgi:hypothetical protein
MDFAGHEAASRGLTRMALYTHEVMTENQAIYAHLGYTEVERRAEDGYRRIYMEKSLPALMSSPAHELGPAHAGFQPPSPARPRPTAAA